MPSTHKAVYLANNSSSADEYANSGGGGSSGSGGHEIQDSTGQSMPSEPNLQFNIAFNTTDSSSAEATVLDANKNSIVSTSSLGSVETSSGASQSHPEGDIFTYNNVLVRATDDIAIGGVIEGNVTQTSLNDEVIRMLEAIASSGLETYSVTVPTSSWTVALNKYVALVYPASGKKFADGSLIIITLEAGCSEAVTEFATVNALRPIEITPDGALKLQSNNAATIAIPLSIAATSDSITTI